MPIKANYAYSLDRSLPILQAFMHMYLYMAYTLCTCGWWQTIPCFFFLPRSGWPFCLVPANTWHLQLSQSVPRIFSSFMALFAFPLGDLKQISEREVWSVFIGLVGERSRPCLSILKWPLGLWALLTVEAIKKLVMCKFVNWRDL